MSELSDYFALDPHKHTRTTIVAVIQAFRDRAAQFNAGNLTAGNTKPVTAKVAETMKAVKSDNLDL